MSVNSGEFVPDVAPRGDIAGREGVAGAAYGRYFDKERMTMTLMNDE